MKYNLSLLIGLVFLAVLSFIIVVGPYLPFVDRDLETMGAVRTDEGFSLPPFKPSNEYWLGSDRKGVDLLSKIILGARDMMLAVMCITAIRYVIAIPFGFFAFYFKGLRIMLNLLNQATSFVPGIFMIILFVNMPYLIYSPNRVYWVTIIIALLDVGRVADMIMQQVHIISQKPYIEAAITIGTKPFMLMKRYYIPVLYPELIVSIVLDLARTMFIIGQLGIIGIYISHKVQTIDGQDLPIFEMQNTSNAWPLLLDNILIDIHAAYWIPITAGVAISLVVLGFFVLAKGLKQHFEKGYKYL